MNGVENCSVLDSRKTESESQGLGLLQFLRAPHSDCISQGSSWDERFFVLSLISVEHPLDVFKDFSQEELEIIKLFLWKYYCGLLHFIPLPMQSAFCLLRRPMSFLWLGFYYIYQSSFLAKLLYHSVSSAHFH